MNDRLRGSSAPLKIGFLLSLLAIVFGFGVGVMFAEFEDNVVDALTADAQAVVQTAYHGDAEQVQRAVRGSMTYFRRAHIHANGLGFGTAFLIAFLLVFFPKSRMRGYASLSLGVGALGYSTYWALTALMGPGRGGISQAKAVTGWYAITTAGLYFVGLAALIYLFVRTAFLKREAGATG